MLKAPNVPTQRQSSTIVNFDRPDVPDGTWVYVEMELAAGWFAAFSELGRRRKNLNFCGKYAIGLVNLCQLLINKEHHYLIFH